MDKDFFDRVYEICRRIPRGRVTSYGAIARAAGSPGAARMVGWALNKSFARGQSLPAHRVLNRNGMLTGKKAFGNPRLMQQLLEQEGIRVENDQVVDFKSYFWEPSEDSFSKADTI